MKKLLCGSAAVAFSLAAIIAASAGAARAAVYTSVLQYQGTNVFAPPAFGEVTLTEVGANEVDVSVTLTNGLSLFINTGSPNGGGTHNPFLFNTVDSDAVTILAPVGTFFDAGRGTWDGTPFGTFTNQIGCCDNRNGQAHGQDDPLNFSVVDNSGLTFAGIGATFSNTGKVLTLGTGDHFLSNTGGWWFAADIYDGATGQTYEVAARDAFVLAGVPEPATWALMIIGLGGVGALLRRRRSAAAFA
jgi:hypothetical protein